MKLENSFEVTAPPEAAWELLMDVPRVIPCMPGAELIETVDETHWKSRMRVKLGPISLSFLTDVSREEADEAERRVLLATKAREERGRGAASATVESSLAPVEDGTKVTIVTDLALTGMAAQFGRGLVQDVTAQLLEKFASCLEQQLVTAPSADGEADAEDFEAEPPPPISALALGHVGNGEVAGAAQRPHLVPLGALPLLYLWLGMMAVDVSSATAFILAAVFGFVSFLFIRICSEDDPEEVWVASCSERPRRRGARSQTRECPYRMRCTEDAARRPVRPDKPISDGS